LLTIKNDYEQFNYLCFVKLLKTIFDFYINASIHVALSVYTLVRITELYFGLTYNEALDYFIFYGTITGYNFVKYAGIAKLHHRSLTKNLRVIQIFSLCCFLLMGFYMFKLSLEIILYFTPLALLTMFYAVPIFSGLTKNIRNTASLKIFIIALVWAGVTAFIPVILKKGFDLKIGLYIIQRLLFVIALTLPFDIRDLRYDKKYLQTIPQLIGVERTKKLGFIILLITLVMEFFITINQSSKLIYLVVFMVLLFLIQRSTTKQTKYYASFWVEAIPIFWWLLLVINI